MNKEDILKAARKENGNQDLVEEKERVEGGFYAFGAGLALCIIVMALSEILTGRQETGAAFVYCGMMFVHLLSRYGSRKTRKRLAAAVICGIIALALLVVHILILKGVVQP